VLPQDIWDIPAKKVDQCEEVLPLGAAQPRDELVLLGTGLCHAGVRANLFPEGARGLEVLGILHIDVEVVWVVDCDSELLGGDRRVGSRVGKETTTFHALYLDHDVVGRATVGGAVHPSLEGDGQTRMVSSVGEVLVPQEVEDGTVKLFQVVEGETSNAVSG
jgi:hypothetical protein